MQIDFYAVVLVGQCIAMPSFAAFGQVNIGIIQKSSMRAKTIFKLAMQILGKNPHTLGKKETTTFKKIINPEG